MPLAEETAETASPKAGPARATRLDRSARIVGATVVGKTEPEGYPIYDGTAAFGDVVLEYPERGVNEFRPASELTEEMHASGIGKPVTNSHPARLLDKDTARDHVRGVLLKSWSDDGKHRVQFYVLDRELEEDIAAGKVELSVGYDMTPVERPGEFAGKKYSTVQTDIRINHLAVETRARAVKNGKAARIDAEGASMKTKKKKLETEDGETERMDMLSEAALKAIGALPDADKEMILKAVESYTEMEPEEEQDGAGTEDVPSMDMSDMLKSLSDRVDMLEGSDARADAKPDPSLTDKAKPEAFDADKILAKVAAHATAAAEKGVRETTARLDAVRQVTAPVDCYVSGDAIASQVAYVHRMAPAHTARMDAAVKAGDTATIDILYATAQDVVAYNAKNAEQVGDQLFNQMRARSRADSKTSDVELPFGAGG